MGGNILNNKNKQYPNGGGRGGEVEQPLKRLIQVTKSYHSMLAKKRILKTALNLSIYMCALKFHSSLNRFQT